MILLLQQIDSTKKDTLFGKFSGGGGKEAELNKLDQLVPKIFGESYVVLNTLSLYLHRQCNASVFLLTTLYQRRSGPKKLLQLCKMQPSWPSFGREKFDFNVSFWNLKP